MRTGPTLPLAALGVASLLAITARADEPPPMRDAARALLDEGMQRFEAKDFATAAEKFRAARAIDPHRDLFYAEAQAERRRGRCDVAVPLYEAFLATSPPEAEAALARGNVARCKSTEPSLPEGTEPGEGAALPPTTLPAVDVPALVPDPAPPPLVFAPRALEEPTQTPSLPPERRVFWEDGWFWGAAGLGVAGVATGLVSFGAAEGEAGAANEATTLDAYVEARGRAEDLRSVQSVALAVGGGFILLAAIRGVWVGTTPAQGSAQASAQASAPRGKLLGPLTFPFGS